MDSINARIAKELNVQLAQVAAAVGLLGEGATVPFIARYRKEKTGGLDDTQLRKLEERLGYLTELEDRRTTVLKSITEQGKLTPELQRAIGAADTKVELEDIYAPFKPKRRTKLRWRAKPDLSRWPIRCSAIPRSIRRKKPRSSSSTEKGVTDIKAALEGARSILIERIGENAKLVGDLRQWLWATGFITSKVLKGQTDRRRQIFRLFRFLVSPSAKSRRIALWRFYAAATKDFSISILMSKWSQGGRIRPRRKSCRRSTSPSAAGRRTNG